MTNEQPTVPTHECPCCEMITFTYIPGVKRRCDGCYYYDCDSETTNHEREAEKTMNEQPTVPQWICTHCFIHLVNGDCTEVDECGRTPDSIPLYMFDGMHVTPGMLSEYHDCGDGPQAEHYEECDCETREFSWSACDGCGSNLGGERHAVTGWIKEGN